MKLNKDKANKIWDAYFDRDIAIDAFGYTIHKGEHGTQSEYSWTADHIWPKNPHDKHENAPKGASVYENIQPLSAIGNQQKANFLQGVFEDEEDKINFTITGVGRHEGKRIGRMKVKWEDDEHFDWAYDEPEY